MWNQRVLAYAGVLFVALCAGLLLGPCDPTPSDRGEVTAEKKKKKKKKKPKKIKVRTVELGADELACPECNVIVISIDSLRAGHLGAYGYERATSPILDEIANESIVFENAISQSAWSVPSHASMFTGAPPREHGLVLSSTPGKLSKSYDTLAEQLQARGYKTAAFGGGSFISRKYRLSQGFDTAEGKSRNIKRNLAAAEEWLLENGHERFFLFVHGFNLQRPYKGEAETFHEQPVEYDLRKFCRDENEQLTEEQLKYVVAAYDASILYVDQKLGQFFDFMRKNKLFKNSIVIVTSDNGEAFFEHGKCDHAHSVYRELTHVPLIVRLPSVKKARVADQVAASTSLMPTVLGILGTPPAAGADPALDLRSVVKGEAKQAYVISETGRGRRMVVREKQPKLESYQAAISTPEWRLIYTHENGKPDKFELFSQKDTPPESKDQARKQAKVVKELRKALFPPAGAPILPALDPPTPVEPETAPAEASAAPAPTAAPAAAPPTVKVTAPPRAPDEKEPEGEGE